MNYAGSGVSVPVVGKVCITVRVERVRDCGARIAHVVEESMCWRAVKNTGRAVWVFVDCGLCACSFVPPICSR